jgi:uncharacterized integral membrane protein (TIGR00698 family)
MPPPPASVVPAALFVLAVLFALTPFASPGLALAVGLALALSLGNPWPAATKRLTRPLLQASVVLLGFGTNLLAVLVAARHGLLIAAATIALTFLLGAWLRRILWIESKTAMLLSAGTAICGGSAIAAVGLATGAAEAEMSVALGTVFLLNAVALFLFPVLGHALGLSQVQFGTWAGIAIHDVSSVVAAASAYGPQALQTATVVKLSRTLWIVPVALAARFVILRGRTDAEKARDASAQPAPSRRPIAIPWFIALFVFASLAGTVIPVVHALAPSLTQLARIGMTLVGVRPVLHGIGLWLAISVMALAAVRWAGI